MSPKGIPYRKAKQPGLPEQLKEPPSNSSASLRLNSKNTPAEGNLGRDQTSQRVLPAVKSHG